MNTEKLIKLINEKMTNIQMNPHHRVNMRLITMRMVYKLYDYNIENAIESIMINYQKHKFDKFLEAQNEKSKKYSV